MGDGEFLAKGREARGVRGETRFVVVSDSRHDSWQGTEQCPVLVASKSCLLHFQQPFAIRVIKMFLEYLQEKNTGGYAMFSPPKDLTLCFIAFLSCSVIQNGFAQTPGTQKWAFTPGGSIYSSSPATGTDGTVYVGSNDKKLYAIVSKQWPCSKSLAKVRQV